MSASKRGFGVQDWDAGLFSMWVGALAPTRREFRGVRLLKPQNIVPAVGASLNVRLLMN